MKNTMTRIEAQKKAPSIDLSIVNACLREAAELEMQCLYMLAEHWLQQALLAEVEAKDQVERDIRSLMECGTI